MIICLHGFAFTGAPFPADFTWLNSRIFVAAFFIIGGYFLAQSWQSDPCAKRFFLKRILRIFPGLAICIFLTVFLLGPMVTQLPLETYFQSKDTYAYFKTLALYIIYYLPGVFTDNIFPIAVNGSLWTLPIEFFLYFCLVFLGLFSIPGRWIYPFLALVSAIITLWGIPEFAENWSFIYSTELKQIFICGYYFWIGATFFAFNLKQYFSLFGAIIAGILFLLSTAHELTFQFAKWIIWPYFILSLGLASSFKISNWMTRHGDFSYSIYIYAFPIQQTIAMFFPSINIIFHILMSFICVIPCALLSWKCIEQPMLRFKPKKIPSEPAIRVSLETS